MYKSLFISLNIIGMFMVPILYLADISITQSGKNQVNAGEGIEVTIDINKDGVAGPARLKLDLTNAQGIEIEDIETEGASFSFNETSALFIWYSIKPDSKITLKYKIIADADASGSKSITGSFSYLDQDERKKTEIQEFNFTISGDGTTASNTDPEVIEGSDENETVEVVTTSPEDSDSSTENNPSENSNNEETANNATQNNDNSEENNSGDNSTNEEVEGIASTEENNDDNNETEEPEVIEGEDEDSSVEVVSTSNTSESSNTSPDKVKCSRNIEKQGEDFIITVSIYKGINGGFARVKEDIPLGFIAEKIEAAGAIFKFADNSAKFLWSQIPKNVENVVIKYKLTPPANASGDYTIRGSFSAEFLIEDQKPKKLKIATSTINVGGVLANNGNNSNTSSNNNGDNSNSTSNNSDNDNSKTNTSSSADNSGSTTVGSTSSNGIKYRVQIIAAHNTVSKRYIKKAFGYSGAVNIDNHQGWVKYTTNGYPSYKEARTNRNSLNRYDFDGPFVTAYNEGDRITVQEALMISNQSWIQ